MLEVFWWLESRKKSYVIFAWNKKALRDFTCLKKYIGYEICLRRQLGYFWKVTREREKEKARENPVLVD